MDVEAEILHHPVTSVTGLHMLSLGKQFTTLVLAGMLLEDVMVSGCFSRGKKLKEWNIIAWTRKTTSTYLFPDGYLQPETITPYVIH